MAQVRSKSRIYGLRHWFGLTQQEFASAAGVSERAVIRWEAGEVEPMPATQRTIGLLEDLLQRLAERYGELL